MPGKCAPGLFLDVHAFWFVLRWLLRGRGCFSVRAPAHPHRAHQNARHTGRASLRVVGVLRRRGLALMVTPSPLAHPRTGQRDAYLPTGRPPRVAPRYSVLHRDALRAAHRRPRLRRGPDHALGVTVYSVVLALADDAVWVPRDDSSTTCPPVGRMMACWARRGLVSHAEPSRRGQKLELSWPQTGALARGVIGGRPHGDVFAAHLLADELARRA
jgi:hypothetical protein